MNNTIEEKEELSETTYEILSLTDNLKKRTKESMVIGESFILRGVTIFEEIIKEINPDKMDDGIVSMIVSYVSIYVFRQEERNQKINHYVQYGINQCFMMLDLHNKSIKRKIYE